MTLIGDLSYSWYLWHWPLIVFAAALWPGDEGAKAVAALVSIVPAAGSYRWVERPIHLDPAWKGRRALGLATACIAIPVVACLVLDRAPLPHPSGSTRALLQTTHLHADRTRGCNRGLPVAEQPARCSWTVPDPQGRVVLLGDSNAGQFTEPLARASNRLGSDFTVTTLPSCPFIDTVIRGGPQDSERCRQYVERTTRGLVANPPSLITLGASTSSYLRPGSPVTLTDPTTGTVASTDSDKRDAWAAALHRTLVKFERSGIPTLVVHAIPQWLTWDARECAAIRVYLAPRTCGARQSRAADARFRHNALVAESDAVRGVRTASTVDFTDKICQPTECVTNRKDFWVYRDGHHLSVRGALSLTDTLETALRPSLR
ncbi:MAG: acyltransferase [Acidimicrobiia bacterium]|nr:acyltransferase [Acidimicrobiia bacterium]